jgi:hypothetical protein
MKTVSLLNLIIVGIAVMVLPGAMIISGCGKQSTEPDRFIPRYYSYIRDFEYFDGKIFDLGRPEDFRAGDTITDIQVYKSIETTGQPGLDDDTASFFVDPFPLTDTVNFTNENLRGAVKVIDPDSYYVDKDEHWILFDIPIPSTYGHIAVGVYMIIEHADGTVDTVGSNSTEPFKLKLIKHHHPDASMVTWNYVWRNVYFLGSRDIDVDGLEINVFKGPMGTEYSYENRDHQNHVKYIRILGLDRYDRHGNPGPDGYADIYTNIIDPEEGILIFPDRKPFDADSLYAASDSVALDPKVPQIYDWRRHNSNLLGASTYYIKVAVPL